MNAAVASASRGDTVLVPAGAATWTSTLTVTKGLTLQGSGRDLTTLTSDVTFISIEPDATAIANDDRFEITGFTFDGNQTALHHIEVAGAGATDTKPFNKLVIGNNRFANSNQATSGQGVISTRGQVRGVIYGNMFDGNNVILKIVGNDDTAEFSNGNFPVAYGNADNLFFEDNTIQWSSTSTAEDPGWTETGQGGRLAMRYNTWDFTNASGSELQDIHGFQNWPGGGQTGTMISEYYGQTFTNTSGYRFLNLRGGWGLFFNNVVTGTIGGIEVNQYYAGVPGGSGCTSDVAGASGVYTTEVNNTYVFNNIRNGTMTDMVPGSVGNGCGISENTNYWNYNAACTASACTAGIGTGTTPPTGTCTVGVGYWVASTPTPTVDPSVIQASTFYQCTAPDTWTVGYTPFAYPHPLRPDAPTPGADGPIGNPDAGVDPGGTSGGGGCCDARARPTGSALLGLGVVALTGRRRRPRGTRSGGRLT